MTLHENIELYKDAVRATSEHMGLPEIFIEKDYWLTVFSTWLLVDLSLKFE
jgi:hypothetical protein